jgi:hypothetical protein
VSELLRKRGHKMSAEVTLITKFGIDPLMSKRIFLDEQGALQSDGSQCLMIQGEAERVLAGTPGKLAEIISQCPSHSAISLGVLKDGLPSSISITVPRNLKDNPGAITRSRDYIDYRPGVPGWVLIDFDTKGLPTEIAARIEQAGGMWDALLGVASGLSRAARVSRASTSSGLFRSDTGTPVSGSNGTHHYLLLQDGSNPVTSPPGRCLACGDREYGYDPLAPYGVEPTGHAWLHSRCWEAWHAARKREAAAALKAMGVDRHNGMKGGPGHGESAATTGMRTW